MTVEKPRPGRGRPPKASAKLGRLSVNVQQETIDALTTEAAARGVTLSELARLALMDWMRRELPIGRMPHGPPAAGMGVQTHNSNEETHE